MDDFDVKSIHGPLLIGYLFNTILLGILVTQSYIYYTNFKRDNVWTKMAVATLIVANTLHACFITGYLYRIFITLFGNPIKSLDMNWLFINEPFLTALIIFSAQSFFSWRAFYLTRHWTSTASIIIPAMASLAGGLWTGVNFVRRPHFTVLRESAPSITLWLVAGVVSNVAISSIRFYHLVRFFRLSPLHPTDTGLLGQKRPPQRDSNPEILFDRITRILLGSGLITLILATIDLIVYLQSKGTGLHLIFNLPLCKLFSINVMNCLNSRHGYKVRWSSELTPRSVYQTGDVKPGEAIEFKTFATTIASNASDTRTQFDDTDATSGFTAVGEDSVSKLRWSNLSEP